MHLVQENLFSFLSKCFYFSSCHPKGEEVSGTVKWKINRHTCLASRSRVYAWYTLLLIEPPPYSLFLSACIIMPAWIKLEISKQRGTQWRKACNNEGLIKFHQRSEWKETLTFPFNLFEQVSHRNTVLFVFFFLIGNHTTTDLPSHKKLKIQK